MSEMEDHVLSKLTEDNFWLRICYIILVHAFSCFVSMSDCTDFDFFILLIFSVVNDIGDF